MLPEALLLFSVRDRRVLPHWFGPADHPWLRSLQDEYERFVGRPRRELAERLRDPLPRAAPAGKLKIARHVLDGLHGSDRVSIVPPRQARRALFTCAAVGSTVEGRDLIVARAAQSLGIEPSALEESLFSDLPGERRLGSPKLVIDPATLAVRSNLALAQGLLFRAAHVRIELEGEARLVVRHAKLRGLIGTVAPRSRTQDACLELSGPFALFRRTLLYGRALAELIPLLAWCDRFRLEAELVLKERSLLFELGTGDTVLPAREPRRFDSKIEERFARDFKKLAPDWDVVREPEPVAADGTLIFPDFALQHRRDPSRRWLLEIVGFWTKSYLEEKLRRLRAAAVPDLILCVDEEKNVGDDAVPAGAQVVRYRRRIDPAVISRILDECRHAAPAPRARFAR